MLRQVNEYPVFPFPAIVGNDTARKAILCILVNEDLKGLLITGGCGSAKTTLARSAGKISDGKSTTIIPQNTTGERLFGSIDIENAITKGKISITEGILAENDRRIVVVDDINLFDEKVIHTILDTAGSGNLLLERDGFSENIRTRYILIATMDPEEGGLSSRILDRFDLCVETERIEYESGRLKIIRSCMAFEKDPVSFSKKYSSGIEELRENIRKAKERLPFVTIPGSLIELISELCIELNVSGQRGDIALAKTAKTLAAIDGRGSVVFEDIRQAALLSLEHRRRNPPPGSPQGDPPDESEQEDERENENDRRDEERPGKGNDNNGENREEMQDHGERDSPDNNNADTEGAPPEQAFEIGSAFSIIEFLDEHSLSRLRSGNPGSGRRRRSTCSDSSGRYVSYRHRDRNKNDIAIDATLRAAAPFQTARDRKGLAIKVEREDLREKVREKRTDDIILFLVDASGSMGVKKRMVAVKGAVLSLLNDAYHKRDMVGLMIFRRKEATLLLPPTRSTDLAYKMLKEIPTGGRTPLSKGVVSAVKLLSQGRYSKSTDSKTIVILTDGRANYSGSGRNPYEELRMTARAASEKKIRFVVVDTEEGFPRLDFAVALAFELGATYLRLDELDSRKLAQSVETIVKKEHNHV